MSVSIAAMRTLEAQIRTLDKAIEQQFETQHTQLIKSGNGILRYYLLEAANSVRRCDSEFRHYYDLKFKEVNQFQHKRALALTVSERRKSL